MILFCIATVIFFVGSLWFRALWHETCRRLAKTLADNIKLRTALLRIASGDDKEKDPYGYIPRDEFRKIAEDALKENKTGLLPHINAADMPPMPKVKLPKSDNN